MKKKAQESEAARFAPFWLLRKLEKSGSSRRNRHIGSLKIREVEGGVLERRRSLCFFGTAVRKDTLGYVLHRALHI